MKKIDFRSGNFKKGGDGDKTGKHKEREKETEDIKRKFLEARRQMEDVQQYMRNKNVLIDGVPRKQGENLKQIMIEMGSKVGLRIEESQIDGIHRLPSNNMEQLSPIVTQITSRTLRYDFIERARSRRFALKDTNVGGEEDVYVSEHLTAQKKKSSL